MQFDPNNDIYWTDVQIQPSGDIAVSPGGDLMLATQTDNLKQFVRNWLFTNQSEYLFGTFGSNVKSYVDTPLSPQNIDLIKREISATLLQETRIQSVQINSVSNTQTGGIIADLTVTSTAGDTVRISVSSDDS